MDKTSKKIFSIDSFTIQHLRGCNIHLREKSKLELLCVTTVKSAGTPNKQGVEEIHLKK